MRTKKRVLSVFLSFVMILSCIAGVPVLAQETEGSSSAVSYEFVKDLSEISAEEEYVLVAWRYFGGTDSDSTKGYVFHSENNGNLRVSTADSYATVTYGENEGVIPDSAVWKLDGADGSYSIQNVATGKYLGSELTADNEEATAFAIVSGVSNSCDNYAIGLDGSSIRYSGSSARFSLGGSDPSTEVTRTNACNITIYKVVEPKAEEPEEPTEHKIFFASDYQGSPAEQNLIDISNVINEAGVTPELAVWCGDYVDGSVYADGADVSQSQMMGMISKIKDTMTGEWPELEYVFLQGNHDYSGFIDDGTLNSMGAIEHEDYIIYVMNEDDYPWWQGVNSNYANAAENKKTVQKTADTLEAYLNELIQNNCDKPVIIATHIPLSWSTRSTTGTTWWSDNIYANIMFEVINNAAKELDIVYLYGHNHSDIYDNYIGGSVNYLGVGDVMWVPNGTTGTENYTKEIINFTYANAGYIGKVNANLVPSISTASIITITDDAIKLEKYSKDGLYAPATRTIERFQYGKPQMEIISLDDDAARQEATEETFKVLVENVEAVSYEWSSDSDAVQFVSGADSNEVVALYAAAGDVNVTCKITYTDAEGQTQEIQESYAVTVKEQPKPTDAYKQVTDLSTLTDEGEYVLVGWRYFGGSNSDSTKGYVLHSENNGNMRVDTADSYATVSYADGMLPDGALWNIIATEDGYVFKNVATGKYIGNFAVDSDEAATYQIVSGTCNGQENFALSTDGSSIRYSGTSGKFSTGGSDGATEASRANACNFTIYKFVCVEHTYGDWETVKEAGCTEPGEKQQVCTKCNDTITEEIPSTGHAYGDWETVKEAGCTEPGEKQQVCTKCNDTITEEIPSTGHAYGDWETVKEAGCTEAGEKQQVCANCEDKITEEIPSTGHAYGDWETVKEAGCTEAGEKQQVCANCEDKITEEIPSTGHAYGDWETVKEPTTEEEGERQQVCANCQDVQTEAIEKLETPDEPVVEPDEPVVDPDEPTEEPDEPSEEPDEPSEDSEDEQDKDEDDAAPTGDAAQTMVWVFCMIAALGGCVLIEMKKRMSR